MWLHAHMLVPCTFRSRHAVQHSTRVQATFPSTVFAPACATPVFAKTYILYNTAWRLCRSSCTAFNMTSTYFAAEVELRTTRLCLRIRAEAQAAQAVEV